MSEINKKGFNISNFMGVISITKDPDYPDNDVIITLDELNEFLEENYEKMIVDSDCIVS